MRLSIFISVWLLALSALSQATINNATLKNVTLGTAASGCTVATGDLANESFEGAVDTGWTQFGTNATWGDVNAWNNFCSGLGTKSLGIVTTNANTAGYYYDFGSLSAATRYWRFYFYIDSSSQASTDKNAVFVEGEGSSGLSGWQTAVILTKSGSQFQLYLNVPGGGNSSAINISVTTAYRVEINSIFNGVCTLHIYDQTGTELGGSPVTATEGGGDQSRYVQLGIPTKDNSQNCSVHIDGFGASSTGYLGQ